jgi:hypothetical protein
MLVSYKNNFEPQKRAYEVGNYLTTKGVDKKGYFILVIAIIIP